MHLACLLPAEELLIASMVEDEGCPPNSPPLPSYTFLETGSKPDILPDHHQLEDLIVLTV